MSLRSVVSLYSCLKISILLRKNFGIIPFSRLNILILKKLISLGYMSSFVVFYNKSKLSIKFFIIFNSSSVLPIQGLKLLISSNTKLIYLRKKQLCRLNFGAGVFLISTSRGILTKSEAILLGTGGLPLFSIW